MHALTASERRAKRSQVLSSRTRNVSALWKFSSTEASLNNMLCAPKIKNVSDLNNNKKKLLRISGFRGKVSPLQQHAGISLLRTTADISDTKKLLFRPGCPTSWQRPATRQDPTPSAFILKSAQQPIPDQRGCSVPDAASFSKRPP